MQANRSRYGLLVSALGAIMLAVSIFLPWYGLSFTAKGIALIQQVSDQVTSQFGNSALQDLTAGLHARLGTLAGHQFAAVSAHQVLKNLNVVLLVLAGLAILITLIPLARPETLLPDGEGALVALLGVIATVCVLFRMVDPPTPASSSNLLSLSLREGAWLALLGSLAMVAGGFWPRGLSSSWAPSPKGAKVWSELSGWTPET